MESPRHLKHTGERAELRGVHAQPPSSPAASPGPAAGSALPPFMALPLAPQTCSKQISCRVSLSPMEQPCRVPAVSLVGDRAEDHAWHTPGQNLLHSFLFGFKTTTS